MDPVVTTLKLIAAKAEKLAYDVENARLWDGDLSRGLSELRQQIDDAQRLSKDQVGR